MTELTFWFLVLAVLQPFSSRVAVVALLLIAHIDMSGPGFDSAGRVGVENGLKALLLPAWLVVRGWLDLKREGGWKPRWVLWNLISRRQAVLWFLFVAYATLAVLWSPYPLSGVKLAAALVSHTLVFLALVLHWLNKRLNHRTILLTLVLILTLAVVQTYLVGNVYGSGEGQNYSRLTTFSGPQSFVESFAALGSILIWYPGSSVFGKLTAAGLLLGGAFLSGSRIGFLGALAIVSIWLVRKLDAKRLGIVVALSLAILWALSSGPVRKMFETSRIGEIGSVIRSGKEGILEVGTFRWRAAIYRCLWKAQSSKKPAEVFFGSGTSSLGVPGLMCEPDYDPARFSPNRISHCEFLRVFYEWGVIGLVLFLGLLAGLLGAGWQAFIRAGKREPKQSWRFGPMVSVLPLLFLSLSFENLIQGPLSPGMVGFIAVLALRVAERLRWQLGRQEMAAGTGAAM